MIWRRALKRPTASGRLAAIALSTSANVRFDACSYQKLPVSFRPSFSRSVTPDGQVLNADLRQKLTLNPRYGNDGFVPLLVIPRPLVETSSGRERASEVGERATTVNVVLWLPVAEKQPGGWRPLADTHLVPNMLG